MAKYDIVTDKVNNFFTNNKLAIADAVPTSGTYTKGDMVLAKTPTTSVYGWICTADGTPGTWQVLKSASVLNKSDIENIFTGQIRTHSHNRLDIDDTRNSSFGPVGYAKGFNVEFKNRESVNNPGGPDEFLNVMTMKGWDDRSGGGATQLVFGGDGVDGPDVRLRTGSNDSEHWNRWYKMVTDADNMISVKNKGADHGFGSNERMGGFIGRYPGWDPNGLYINTFSEAGNRKQAYDNVHIMGNWVNVEKILRAGSIESNWIDNIVKLQFTSKFSAQYICEGNGDAAEFGTHNLIIRSWWGIGFRNNDDVCTILMNTRAGDIKCKGALFTDNYVVIKGSKIFAQGDDPGYVGAGSIWIKTV